MVIVDRQGNRKLFPGRLPAALSSLGDNYTVRNGGGDRVAGFESRIIIIEPKDDLRYGHMLWADRATGLLLKARMLDERKEGVEQFYFTHLQIGGTIDPANLKSKFSGASSGWHVSTAHRMEEPVNDSSWAFGTQIPGFKKSVGMKQRLQDKTAPVIHYVFSDGLAAISVFIEPLSEKQSVSKSGTYTTGAISVYKRIVGKFLLTLVGEVPMRTLRKLGDGIEFKEN
jgi:sigma-E factor negative regulatory protein RseB